MCIAIYKPKSIRIKHKTLENCFLHHPDGAGYVVHDESTNTLIVKKGFFTVESLWASIKQDMHHNMILHFRWATHGLKDEANCHPFMVNDNLAFIHNGVIRDVRQWNKDFSDTWHFNEAIMKRLVVDYPNIWQNNVMRFLIEQYIGGSKLIFMDNMGNFEIYNEQAGVWDCGCWWSNTSYQKAPVAARQRVANDDWRTRYTGNWQKSNTQRVDSYVPEAIGLDDVPELSTEIDPTLSDYYRGQDISNDEMLLETLFKECEDEELRRDAQVEAEKLNKIDLNLVM